MMNLDSVRKIADTILYEGYLLYPYRASHPKNLTRVRWQFGVLIPQAQAERDTTPAAATVSGAGETWYSATECIVEADGPDTAVDVRLRFLRVQSRSDPPGDEGTETELDQRFTLGQFSAGEQVVDFELPATREEAGEVVRERQGLTVRLRAAAELLPGPYGIAKLSLRVENVTDWAKPDAGRDEVLAHSPVAAHLVLVVTGGRFVSLVDPPEWAKPAAGLCRNEHTWPVLVGSPAQDTLLSAPMVLPDFPEIAPESPTDLFDGLENDELLSLRIMTLTEEEKAEARATDPRAAAIVDSVDNLPPELYQRLHGAIRSLEAFPEIVTDDQGEVRRDTLAGVEEGVPWWNPAADASVDPDTDTVPIAGRDIGRGSRVRLKPGLARSDAQDMFLVDKEATVAAVLFDVDDEPYLAVVLDDDPGADIMRWHGRYLYFKPFEVEAL